jgi:hypothetical protein
MITIVSGLLALAYGVANPVLAIHIGTATPFIVQTFARNAPDLTTGAVGGDPGAKQG